MIRRLLTSPASLVLVLLCFAVTGNAQNSKQKLKSNSALKKGQGGGIWPGDIDNNGIVNAEDLLYLGVAYEEEGPEREAEDQNANWYEHDYEESWKKKFKNKVDYAFADADGNGVVDEGDLDAILLNYDQTHGAVNEEPYTGEGEEGVDPSLFFLTENEGNGFYPGQEIRFQNPFGGYRGARKETVRTYFFDSFQYLPGGIQFGVGRIAE